MPVRDEYVTVVMRCPEHGLFRVRGVDPTGPPLVTCSVHDTEGVRCGRLLIEVSEAT